MEITALTISVLKNIKINIIYMIYMILKTNINNYKKK